MSIGLKSKTVILEPHQDEWEAEGKRICAKIKELLGDDIVDVQHVGSTSIRGISAKPIIDIAVAVRTFEDIRKRIESLDAVPMVEATQLFNSAAFSMDLGIYHLTSQGGWISHFTNSIINKVVEHSNKTVFDAMSENEDDGWRVRIKKLMPIPSNRPNGTALEYTNTYLCHQSLDWVYKDGFTKDGIHWSENRLPGAGGPKSYTKDDKLPYSIKFDTETEAYNFQSYTKTKFFKYIYSTMKTDQNVPLKYLPFMPSYTHPWTDEMLCEYFGLTEN